MEEILSIVNDEDLNKMVAKIVDSNSYSIPESILRAEILKFYSYCYKAGRNISPLSKVSKERIGWLMRVEQELEIKREGGLCAL